MSDLIPEINWDNLVQIVKDGKVGELKACEVKFNGSYLFTAIIPHGDVVARDYIRIQSEYLALKANISGGVDPGELLIPTLDGYPNLTKAREARRLTREGNIPVLVSNEKQLSGLTKDHAIILSSRLGMRKRENSRHRRIMHCFMYHDLHRQKFIDLLETL